MKTDKRHINIPVFIPHLGCPNMCVFCNQKTISGTVEFDRGSVRALIDEALSTVPPDAETEIAFFGGSFTGIDRDLMIYLLDLANEYVQGGRVGGIRLSTRPDYINDEILEILRRYPVRTVELGIQSMDDGVLNACRRGHTAAQSEHACRAVKACGFELIGQMMTGLPGATPHSEVETARSICRLGADGARVYPTVVFCDTELCRMAQSGEYSISDENEIVIRTKDVLAVFAEAGVPVIRVGLCASENLADDSMVWGGANHSAVGELAMGELYMDIISRSLTDRGVSGGSVVIAVPRGETSKAVGQKKKNTIRLRNKFSLCDIKFVEDDGLPIYNVVIKSYVPQRRIDHCT
ncbi:MAG: radical SAM protein [Clostridia bacterium]|nr:radical SAM protein [Clostridia bacterium]